LRVEGNRFLCTLNLKLLGQGVALEPV
jgi:hypothetical protein